MMTIDRRNFLKQAGAMALGLMATPRLAAARNEERILIVLEMSGGNDGLNTVIPFRQDPYYRARPTLGIAPNAVIPLSDEFGLHPNLLGWERLYKQGQLAIVHGCGYPNPNRSHFEAMKFWHTGVPNAPETYGWIGKLADAADPSGTRGLVMNLAAEQSQAVASANHPPVVFSDPAAYRQEQASEQAHVFDQVMRRTTRAANPSLDFVRRVTQTAAESSDFVRKACASYRTRSDYGYGPLSISLKNIAALINANAPARFYYTNFAGFDTHVSQGPMQAGLFNQIGDSVLALLTDIRQMGRGQDVVMVIFSEFGRRVNENKSLGTDHGVAGPMFVFGEPVQGGLYGNHPSLTELDQGDLIHTTDFRQVYSTLIENWMGVMRPEDILYERYESLGFV